MAFGEFRVLEAEDQALRQNRKVSDTSILSGSAANALEQGEFMVPTTGAKRTVERYTATDGGPVLAFPVAGRKGSTDAQALGKTELYIDWASAETTSYDPGGSYSVGTLLKVNQVSISGVNRSVLTPATSGQQAVAVVENPPDTPADHTKMLIRRVAATVA